MENKRLSDKLIETENTWLQKMDNYKKLMFKLQKEKIDEMTEEWKNERNVSIDNQLS